MSRFYIIIKFLLDKNISLKEKWWVIIPLIYILSPADLIPAPVLGYSIIDDAVMLVFLFTVVFNKTRRYYFENDGNKKNEKDKDFKENIVENVEYEIRKDEE
ncbi:MAG: YkvA family protein [Sedimentibacter sp.]|uniref:YkvA family protein n=1 Tax=Sedimentibacter sp. TaxID=1960295 RepID=UPI0029825939|nr:YkvA family protein [Sedimentibacter sp.]MDW5299724.1 YkvA family protein [Sedimentibacter sp.]